MKYVAIDLGDKRVWIAHESKNFAFARDIVKRTDIIKYLKKISRDYQDLETIIVWLPYDLYGIDTKQLDKTEKFIEKLRTIFPLLVIQWHDERFSSYEASRVSGWHRDDIAAQCILQSYLDSNDM